MRCSKFLIFFYNSIMICTSPQLCPWPVWRAPWSSWRRLLDGAHCLMVLQTLGPFRTGVYCIYWDHVTLRLHKGGFYWTNYVTSEGNWLHQTLLRGFIGGEYLCTHHFSLFLNFTSPIWTILCMSITWNDEVGNQGSVTIKENPMLRLQFKATTGNRIHPLSGARG